MKKLACLLVLCSVMGLQAKKWITINSLSVDGNTAALTAQDGQVYDVPKSKILESHLNSLTLPQTQLDYKGHSFKIPRTVSQATCHPRFGGAVCHGYHHMCHNKATGWLCKKV